jgi:hypothetical protein
MNLFNKIKTNYNSNYISDQLKNNNLSDIKDFLEKMSKKDKNVFLELSKNFLPQILTHPNSDSFFQKSFIWLNTFNHDDNKLISKFLKFYFDNSNSKSYKLESYEKYLFEIVSNYESTLKKISFNDSLGHSFLYQYLISLINKNNYNFVESSGAFFENNKKYTFINQPTTYCYFHIIRNPINIYSDLKRDLNDRHQALNILCNLDQRLNEKKLNEKFIYEENRQSWSTFVTSWEDYNVNSTFRGMSIKYESLISDPETVLSQIIAHLVESSINIDLNYDLIDKFISENKNAFKSDNPVDLSQNEKKILDRELGQSLLKNLNYSL